MIDDHDAKPDGPSGIKIQIDKATFDAPSSRMSAYDLLRLAGKKPAESYAVYLRFKGGQPKRIDLDEKVDLSRLGLAHFLTLPLDQTEGQRWSRHRTPTNPWRPGIDSLATHVALIEHWFRRELRKG